MDHRGRRQPFAAEHVQVERPREGSLALVRVRPIRLVGDADPLAVGLDDLVDRPRQPDQHPAERRRVVEAVRVEERLIVACGERKAPLVRLVRVRLEVEDAARSLLLQPFAGVPMVNARSLGELGRCQRSGVGQRSVQTQPVADVDAEQIERLDRAGEELAYERVSPLLGRCRRVPICVPPSQKGRIEIRPLRVRCPGG